MTEKAKEARREYYRRWREEHREHYSLYQKQYYQLRKLNKKLAV